MTRQAKWQKLAKGFFPTCDGLDGGWVIFPKSARKPNGCIDWKDCIETGFASAEEAEARIKELT